jgi:Outer membrane protein beta-barrel domain
MFTAAAVPHILKKCEVESRLLDPWSAMSYARMNKTILSATKFLLFLGLIMPALAQSAQSGPAAAASGPSFDVNVGYSYMLMHVPDSGNINLNGVDGGAGIDFNRRWGALVDSSYLRTGDVFGTGHSSYVLSALAGPVFYPYAHGETRISLRGLVGAGLVDSAVTIKGPTDYLHGWVARPAYGAGVGVERTLFGPFAFRFNADYLRTSFVNAADTLQQQNNLRITGGIVFRLNAPQSSR